MRFFHSLWKEILFPQPRHEMGTHILPIARGGSCMSVFHDEIQYLSSSLPRDFTEEERKQYEINDTKPTCSQP
jgi:hypothetical protein